MHSSSRDARGGGSVGSKGVAQSYSDTTVKKNAMWCSKTRGTAVLGAGMTFIDLGCGRCGCRSIPL